MIFSVTSQFENVFFVVNVTVVTVKAFFSSLELFANLTFVERWLFLLFDVFVLIDDFVDSISGILLGECLHLISLERRKVDHQIIDINLLYFYLDFSENLGVSRTGFNTRDD